MIPATSVQKHRWPRIWNTRVDSGRILRFSFRPGSGIKNLNYYEEKTVDVVVQMNSVWKKQVEENRRRPIPIIQIIRFCGRQSIALRVMKDFRAWSLEEPDFNDGNFCSSLRPGVSNIGPVG